MNKKFKFKLFGWYIYLSRRRMKNRSIQLKVCSETSLKKLFCTVRNSRYKTNNGCCEYCGQQKDKSQVQMHHVLPRNVFPLLAREDWNLMMLCQRCHFTVHHNPILNGQLMQKVASQHGIDLTRELPDAIDQRWQEHLQKEGDAA